MSGSANGLAHQALGVDFIAAPTKTAVDTTANGTVILAASAAPGLYDIETDADVYVRQVEVGTAITAAGSRKVPSGALRSIYKYSDLEVRGITSSGTANVEVTRAMTPQD